MRRHLQHSCAEPRAGRPEEAGISEDQPDRPHPDANRSGRSGREAADPQLAHSPYLTGNEITVADIGLYPIYAGRKALIDGAGLKNVAAWGERVGARPAVQKGMKLES